MSQFDSSSLAVRKRFKQSCVLGSMALLLPLLTAIATLFGPSLTIANAASITWTTPQEPISNAVYPYIHVAANGVIGLTASGSSSISFYVSGNGGQSYGRLVSFSTTSSYSAHPMITSDGSSNFYLIWQDRDPNSGSFHAYYSKISSSGSAGPAIDVSAMFGVTASVYPAMTVSSDGQHLYLADQEGSALGFYESDNSGANWSQHFTVPGKSANAGGGYTRIALDSNNNPHMIFCATDGNVYTYSRNTSGAWSLAQVDNLGTPGGRSFWSDIALAPNGDMYAVWQEDLQSGVAAPKEISAARWDHSSQSWQPEVQNISRSSSAFGGSTPGVTVDSNGTAWFVWGTWNTVNNIYGVQYATSTNGSSFSAPVDAMPQQYIRGTSAGGTVEPSFGGGKIFLSAQLADSSSVYGAWVASTTVSAVSPTPTPPSPLPNAPYTYYLPFLANAYNNSFSTFVALQNVGSSAATVQVLYYDQNGNYVAANSCSGVAKSGECVEHNPFQVGSKGSGVVTSTQPLNVVVAESTPYGGSAYTVTAGGSSSLIAPFAINGDYGFTTQLTVYNGSSSAANSVQVQFYDKNGQLQSGATQTIRTLAAHTAVTFDQSSNSNLPANFDGWAQITGGSSLVAQVLEQNAASRFVAVVNAQAQAHTTLYAPAVFKGAFGGFGTGANIINPNGNAVTVSITYYDANGNALKANDFTVNAHSVQQIYHPSTSGGAGLPGNGLPAGYAGAAVVTSNGGGIVMSVNEAGGSTAAGNSRSGVYLASSSGNGTLGLPVIANNGSGGFTTGLTLLNTSGNSVSGTIQYYNLDGSTALGNQGFTIPAHGSYVVYHGSLQGLSNGFYGVAFVTENGGGSDLIATTNAQSSSFFYSYSQPGN